MCLQKWPSTALEAGYPDNLRPLPHPPPLFRRGELGREDASAVAVVGTRSASPAGTTRARLLAAALAGRGVTVVSGLARGIDTAAHTACLDAGGRTIAVLGCGIDRVYPLENAGLAGRIAAAGAVLSQLGPGTPPSASALRGRNALIAGLARATVVVEAGPLSGARIAARRTLELGRPLFLTDLVAEQAWAAALLEHPGVRLLTAGQGIEPLLAVAGAKVPGRPGVGSWTVGSRCGKSPAVPDQLVLPVEAAG